jgi:translation initiation factor IF-2
VVAVVGASAELGELEAVSEAAPDSAAEAEARPGRVSKPMIAAAVAVGLVLVGVPLVISQLGGPTPPHRPTQGGAPLGYSQQGPNGGNGFVPGFDSHGDTGGSPIPPGQPAGAAAPVAATDSGSPSPSGQPANGSGGGSGGSGGSSGGGGTGGGGGTSGGGGTGGGAPQQQSAPQQPTQPASPNPKLPPMGPGPVVPPSAPAPVVAVAGPFCGGSGVKYRTDNWYTQGQSGWTTNSGGWSGNGCNGQYNSMPMSGSHGDYGNDAVWTFQVGSVKSCDLAVYIPASGDIMKVGGNPSFYTVNNGAGSIGSFSINQTASQGQWVDEGSFPYNGMIYVTLHDRGIDWTDTAKTYAHHAADAIKATCTS